MQERTLEWPPTVNTMYVPVRGRKILSKRGRQWKEIAALQIGQLTPIREKLANVTIVVHPPDRRRRDIDNLIKPVLDALTTAGAWYDDCQVTRIEIERGELYKGGKVVVRWEGRSDGDETTAQGK